MLQHMAMSGSTHKAVGSSPCLDLTNGGTGGGGQNGILSDALRISYIYMIIHMIYIVIDVCIITNNNHNKQ